MARALVDVTVRDLDKVTGRLSAIERRELPFATALAMTRTAQATQAGLREEMQRVFDRPTRWTLGSLRYTAAKKSDFPRPFASVHFQDTASRGTPAVDYLMPQMQGGPRSLRKFERKLDATGEVQGSAYAIPARGVRLNASGNMTLGRHKKVLEELGKSGGKHFVRRNVIWVRRSKRRLEPVMVLVRQPSYTERFDFDGVGAKLIAQEYPKQFGAAMQQALASKNP